MDPTSLPELFEPFRDQNFEEKTEKMEFQNLEKKSKILTTIIFFSVVGSKAGVRGRNPKRMEHVPISTPGSNKTDRLTVQTRKIMKHTRKY